jgi:hypothetical protein
MSDTVKLIIDIPVRILNTIQADEMISREQLAILQTHIQNGILLDDVKAEIEGLSNANPSYWHSGDMVEREEVLEIIDSIGEGTANES